MDKQNDENKSASVESVDELSRTTGMVKDSIPDADSAASEPNERVTESSSFEGVGPEACSDASCCNDFSGSGYEKGASEIDPHELGRRGERAARLFLERRGHEILDINWTCFAGEVDIISVDDDTLCFIEVKTRRGTQAGFPEEAVTTRKRDRYEKIAACYLKDHDFADMRVRFDVISIMVIGEHRAFLRMHTNAFGTDPVR